MYILKKNKPLGQRLSASELSALTLRCGAHESAERGHCLLEAVSLFAGEQFGDEPACVDPVLRIFGMGWNDGLPNDAARAQLKRYIPLLPGTRGDGGVSIRRSWMALDWCLRTHLPAWLDLAPSLAEHAARLRGLASLNDQSSLRLALFAVDWASHASARSRVQERDVARATAGGAALGVAWRAARNAAWDATKQA
ncbi:hypothetical protein, partial [Piscinibacter sp.]|uniref:hypothetical protein n=1 Tax=Piscinibacter sp. TaxID=1903157 RepID=UPI002C0ECDBA